MATYRSLKDLVYEQITAEISSGKLKPNAAINEAAICADLEISRTPVREALMQLAHEGYIDHIPRRGFFTRPLTAERIRNIYAIIGDLEAMAAVLAMGRPEHLDLEKMRSLATEIDRSIEAHDYEAYHSLQYAFHDQFIQASGNEELIRLLVNLKKFLVQLNYLRNTSDEVIHPVLVKMNHEHWQIIRLLESGDREAARAFLRDVHWSGDYAPFHTFI
jgi:DNA-binding GntR family transcriptional regulator